MKCLRVVVRIFHTRWRSSAPSQKGHIFLIRVRETLSENQKNRFFIPCPFLRAIFLFFQLPAFCRVRFDIDSLWANIELNHMYYVKMCICFPLVTWMFITNSWYLPESILRLFFGYFVFEILSSRWNVVTFLIYNRLLLFSYTIFKIYYYEQLYNERCRVGRFKVIFLRN